MSISVKENLSSVNGAKHGKWLLGYSRLIGFKRPIIFWIQPNAILKEISALERHNS